MVARHLLHALPLFFAVTACAGDAASVADSPTVALPPDSIATQPAGSAPNVTYIARGACPFECCQYTKWRLRSTGILRAAARPDARVVDTLEVGTELTADSGFVLLDPVGIAIIGTPPPVDNPADTPKWSTGDTIEILDYVGEGYRRVRWKDRIVTVEQNWSADPRDTSGGSRLLREERQFWWVHATTPRQRGWLLMNDTQVSGADACGAPGL